MNPHDHFNYDPSTGYLTLKDSGERAGKCYSQGYRRVCVSRKIYEEHRIIWRMVHGEWPIGEIDHINHVRDDNRLCNLRVVTKGENSRNRSISPKNRTGITGVAKMIGVWEATIAGERLYYGDDLFEACCRRKSAERRYGFHENHGT